MSNRQFFIIACMVAATVIAGSAIGQARPAQTKAGSTKIFCWDTPQGRKCGDTLPADAAGARREELSSRTGVVVKEVERAKTPEELAAEQVRAQEAQTAQEEMDKIARDRSTLRMRYDSIDAINKEYDARRKALEVGLNLSLSSEKASHRSLVAALDDLASMEMARTEISEKAFSRAQGLHKEWFRQREGVNNAKSRIEELEAERKAQIALWSLPETTEATPPSSTGP